MKTETKSLPAICFGEILWDMLPDGPQPGGAPLNVAYHLNKLGVATSIISRIGSDSNGDKLERLLDGWRIRTNLLQRDVCYPTSEVVAKMGNGNEVTYDIVYPVAWDFIKSNDQIKNELAPSTYLIYGSLASRNVTSRDTLLEILEGSSIKVFDINIRPPFVQRDLLKILLEKADIVKFNQAELEMVQLQFGGSFHNEVSQVKFIQERFGISEIVVTKGEFGASYYKKQEQYNAWGSEVSVKDTIGSGDAFLAAFISNHYLNNQPQTIINNAVAMGAFIATRKGGCPDYHLSDYVNFKNQKF